MSIQNTLDNTIESNNISIKTININDTISTYDIVNGDISLKTNYKFKLKYAITPPNNTICVYDQVLNNWIIVPREFIYHPKIPFLIQKDLVKLPNNAKWINGYIIFQDTIDNHLMDIENLNPNNIESYKQLITLSENVYPTSINYPNVIIGFNKSASKWVNVPREYIYCNIVDLNVISRIPILFSENETSYRISSLARFLIYFLKDEIVVSENLLAENIIPITKKEVKILEDNNSFEPLSAKTFNIFLIIFIIINTILINLFNKNLLFIVLSLDFAILIYCFLLFLFDFKLYTQTLDPLVLKDISRIGVFLIIIISFFFIITTNKHCYFFETHNNVILSKLEIVFPDFIFLFINIFLILKLDITNMNDFFKFLWIIFGLLVFQAIYKYSLKYKFEEHLKLK